MSDIQELFSRDPLSHTKEDRTAIIEYFRAHRAKFLVEGKGTKTPKAPAVPKGTKTLSIEDLDL